MKRLLLTNISKVIVAPALVILLVAGCTKEQTTMNETKTKKNAVEQNAINSIIDELTNMHGEAQRFRIERGVNQAANLWFFTSTNAQKADGSAADFREFCIANFVADADELHKMFLTTQNHFEVIVGHMNKIALELRRPVHVDGLEITAIDAVFAGYDPSANLLNDLYANKIAFMIVLNFPYYSLKEKEEFGEKWTRTEWAYARLGDVFTSRIPSELLQQYSETIATADHYTANYNIMMGYLVDNDGNRLFNEDLKFITHWNLRDEIRSQYSNNDGLAKQQMIFEVMQRIIRQEIPESVINSNKYTWNPFSNKVFDNGKEIQFKPEPNTRYQHFHNCFVMNKKIDVYRPTIGNAINAKFDVDFEMPQERVEKMFVDFVSSPQVKEVAEIIKKRLGRDLQPFDIWYDGFKTRSTLDHAMLNRRTTSLFPNAMAYEKDIPNQLVKLGFNRAKANEIASRIAVDASKGAGHAWGAQMKGEKAYLRSRIGENGMDYKGFNIAVHELGHNVEQVLTLYDVDNWFMKGVPNTAFTEAWAFAFQAKDLSLLGINQNVPNQEALGVLDKFWSCYEIMGVSLVDMRVWKWLYENPNCTAEDLKNAVVRIACEVWNDYYAPIFGIKDSPILAIYSHMIKIPLYLSAYPLGHLIEFQIREYIKDKNLATEMIRMSVQGKLIPDIWMKQAVGSEVSIKPLLEAAKIACLKLKE